MLQKITIGVCSLITLIPLYPTQNMEQDVTNVIAITYSVLISSCFALHPYGKQLLIKPE